MKRIVSYFMASVVILSTAGNVSALRQAFTLDEKTTDAAHIVSGKVVSVESAWNEEHTAIYTSVTLDINETVKGAHPGRTVTFQHYGGRVGDHVSMVEEGVRFRLGEHVLVFLNQDERGVLTVHGYQEKTTIGLDDWLDHESHNDLIGQIRDNTDGGKSKAFQSIPRRAKSLAVATVDSVQPNQEAGIDPYGYIRIYGSGFGTTGLRRVRFRRDYLASPPSWRTFLIDFDPKLFDVWNDTYIKFCARG